jgi:DNA-binding transcriptional MerR regulator
MQNKNEHQENQTVEQVAQMLGISKSLIRFWEEEFDLPQRENGALSRLEVAEIKVINRLIKEREMPLEDAKTAFADERKLLEVKHKTLNRLIEIRQSLVGLKDKITENGTSSE